jgi:hypothetical protein
MFSRQTWGEEKGQIEDKVKTEKIDAGEESAESLAQKVKEEMKKIKVESDREEEEKEEQMELSIKKIGRQKEFRRKKEDEDSSSGSGSDNSSGSDSEVSSYLLACYLVPVPVCLEHINENVSMNNNTIIVADLMEFRFQIFVLVITV